MSADPSEAVDGVVLDLLETVLADVDGYVNGQISRSELESRRVTPWSRWIIDAWLRAVVAHQPCNGTGELREDSMSVLGIPGGEVPVAECPGPHVKINTESCPHGERYRHAETGDTLQGITEYCDQAQTLHADPARLHCACCYGQNLSLPLPDGWKIVDKEGHQP